MTIIALAHGMRPEQLLARVADYVPVTRLTTRATDWGAIILINTPFGESGRWLVGGMPQLSPWGVPGTDLASEKVASELDQYGPTAIQMASGPLLAVDMLTGAVLRPLNGIVPLAVSSANGPWAAATSPKIVSGITGTDAVNIQAGSMASPGRAITAVCGTLLSDSVPQVTWAGIDLEIKRQLAKLGPMRAVALARGPALVEDREACYVKRADRADRLIFVPPFLNRQASYDDQMARYIRLREEVLPQLWFRARLLDSWLCAPAFERPALDLVLSVGGGQRSRGPRRHDHFWRPYFP